LTPGREENTLVVNIDNKTREKAPNFDPKEWPKFTEPDWQKEVEIYYELPAIHAESRWAVPVGPCTHDSDRRKIAA